MSECIHLPDYAGETCTGCGEEIDDYGNTENDFRFCSFPDCGCDGARLCMAKNGASERSSHGNVEGMWSGKTREQRAAVAQLVAEIDVERRP